MSYELETFSCTDMMLTRVFKTIRMPKGIFAILVFLISCNSSKKNHLLDSKRAIKKSIMLDVPASWETDSTFFFPESFTLLVTMYPEDIEKVHKIEIFNPSKNILGRLRNLNAPKRDSILAGDLGVSATIDILDISNKPEPMEKLDSIYYKYSSNKFMDDIQMNVYILPK